MVEVTKGKNVTIETYDAESKEFAGDRTACGFHHDRRNSRI